MSTAPAPIRFRCYQCGKLLGVSRSKRGAVVACPRCSAELIVPDVAEGDEAESGADPVPMPAQASPPVPEKPKSSSSSRIEPAVVLWDASPDSEGSSEAAPAFAGVRTDPVSLRPEAPSRPRAAAKATGREVGESVDVLAALATPRPAAAESSAEPLVLPPLAVDPPSLREEASPRARGPQSLVRERPARRDDVVLPRTVMILWSFLVLLAVVFAFGAGLLAGRFLWARGVVVGAPASRTGLGLGPGDHPWREAGPTSSGRGVPFA